MTVVGVLLAGLATLALPGFRDQVELSVSRQPEPFVELYFAPSTSAEPPVMCARRTDSVRVKFVIASHLDRRRAVAYRVAVKASGDRARTQRRAGSVRLAPGTSHQVRTSFTLPRGDFYKVQVELPGLDQQLHARCPGRQS
jgi:hypothetical protein